MHFARTAGLSSLLMLFAVAGALVPLFAEEENPHASALKNLRAAMAARDLPAVKAKLAEAKKLQGDEAYDTELFRLEQLGSYVTQFWQAVDKSGQTLQAQTGFRELKYGDQIGAVVEYDAGRLVIRVEGKNRAYLLSEMPPKLAVAMAEQVLDPKNPDNKVFYGAFAAMDAQGDRKLAKQYWDEVTRANIDIKHLLPELQVPREAAAAVIPALSPTARNLLQAKNWSLRVKGVNGWVKKALGDAGKQNEEGRLVVQTPADSGDAQLVFSRPLPPNFVARVYLDGVKRGQKIGLVSTDGDDDAMLIDLTPGTVMIELGRQAGQLKARHGEEEIELKPAGKGTPRMQALFGIIVPAGTEITVASFEAGVR